jgi:hypothetical protein
MFSVISPCFVIASDFSWESPLSPTFLIIEIIFLSFLERNSSNLKVSKET